MINQDYYHPNGVRYDGEGNIVAIGGIPVHPEDRKMSPATLEMLARLGTSGMGVYVGGRAPDTMEGGVRAHPEK